MASKRVSWKAQARKHQRMKTLWDGRGECFAVGCREPGVGGSAPRCFYCACHGAMAGEPKGPAIWFLDVTKPGFPFWAPNPWEIVGECGGEE